MSGEFLGKFKSSVNKKKWVIIPAVLKKHFSTNSRQMVVLTLGHSNDSVVVYPLDNWTTKTEALKKSEKRLLLKKLRHYAQPEQKLEGNGRVKIDDNLLEKAGIKDKVVIKGDGDYISIWNPENYRKYEEKIEMETKNLFDPMDYQL